MLRVKSSHVVGPEADAPDEVVRAGFGEEFVAVVQKLLKQGWNRKLGEVALENLSLIHI